MPFSLQPVSPKELDRVQWDIKALVTRAMQLGVSPKEAVLEKEIRPGHKEVIDLAALCRSLGVSHSA